MSEEHEQDDADGEAFVDLLTEMWGRALRPDGGAETGGN